ncbi:peptidase associated/transthyretin-like domain-containing protein [Aquimarina sp. M1]
MQKITYIFFLLIISLSFGQKDSWLQGRILVDTLELEAVNIVNLTKEIGAINNPLGYFKIKADPGDEIVFSSVQFRLIKHVVSGKDLQSANFTIFLEPVINELDEVRLSQYSLSGDIQKDAQEIPTYEDRLPLWNAAEIKKMKIIWQDDSQSPVENLALGGGNSQASVSIDLGLLVNLISGVFKQKTKGIEPKLEITDFYKEGFFIRELKIPETEFYNFLDFLSEQTDLEFILKSKDKLKILKYLMDQSAVFKQKYKIRE